MSMSVVAQGALDCNTGSVQADINLAAGVGGHIKLTGNLGEAGTSADITIPGSNCVTDPSIPGRLVAGLYHDNLNGHDCVVQLMANSAGVEIRFIDRATMATFFFTQVPYMGHEVLGFVKPTGTGAVFSFTAA